MLIVGIYKITSPSGKIYIGQSIDIQRRFNSYHKPSGCKGQTKLNNSFIKYGVDNHIFEIIEECDKNELNNRERFYQELYNCIEAGLNCKYVNSDDRTGSLSDEIKNKISKGNKGKKVSDITKEKLSKSCKGRITMIGETHTSSKLVMDTQTGIIYSCVREAAYTYNIPYGTLKDWLRNRYPNKSNLIYI